MNEKNSSRIALQRNGVFSAHSYAQEAQQVPLRILLVEDEPMTRTVSADILRGHGHDVLTASNAEEGIQHYRENHDNIDLIITDIRMPPGMNGLEMCAILRNLGAEQPIVVASSEDVTESSDVNGWFGKIKTRADCEHLLKAYEHAKAVANETPVEMQRHTMKVFGQPAIDDNGNSHAETPAAISRSMMSGG